MSVYSVATTDKGIFNLPREVEAIDVTTRNPYNATIIGYLAGEANQGVLNVMLGYRAGQTTQFGSCNTFLGAQAAEKNVSGADNLIIGTLAARFLRSGSRNVVLGNNSGAYLNGNNNIFIGYNNTIANVLPLSYCNISIGYGANVFGNNNISFGNNSYIFSTKGISVGDAINDSTYNSILMGANIFNKGSNVLIINNRHNSNVVPVSMSNFEDGYMNINDYIVVSRNSSNESVLKLTNDVIEMEARRLAVNLLGANVELGEVMKFVGKYSGLELNKEITIGLRADSNPNAPKLYISSNNLQLGGSSIQNMNLQGSNTSMYMNSNIISLSNNYAELFINSNNVRFGGSNVNTNLIYGSNVTFFLNSNVISLSNQYAQALFNSNNISFGGGNVDNFLLYTSNAYVGFNSNVFILSNNYVQASFSSKDVNIGGVRVNDVRLYGSNNTLLLNSNVMVLSNNYAEVHVESNTFRIGGSNVNNLNLYGSNVRFSLNSNTISLSNNYAETYLDNDTIRIGGTDNKVTTIYGSNNSITMSNGGTFLDSRLVVYRDTVLNNTLTVDKQATFKDDVQIYDDLTAYSNATFEQDIYVNSNSVVYLHSNVTFCNDNRFFIRGSGETHLMQPLVTKSNVFVEHNMSFCNMPVRFVNWDNVPEQELQELYGSTIIQKNLFVGGMTYSSGLNVSDRLVLMSGNGLNQWSQYVSITSNANPYLVFDSGSGTTIKLGDEFAPEIFNFTGKHRCAPKDTLFEHKSNTNNDIDNLIGRIVIATGDYKNLDNNRCISIDEAIPVVELSQTQYDSRAFGVICVFEEKNDKRVYKLGNLTFEKPKQVEDVKVIVNSVGEGGIWVCDANGNLKNGDLIVTSNIAGYGMRQNDDIVRSYTVAKITCDCDFGMDRSDTSAWTPKCKTIIDNGKPVKISFVGCTYKF